MLSGKIIRTKELKIFYIKYIVNVHRDKKEGDIVYGINHSLHIFVFVYMGEYRNVYLTAVSLSYKVLVYTGWRDEHWVYIAFSASMRTWL